MDARSTSSRLLFNSTSTMSKSKKTVITQETLDTQAEFDTFFAKEGLKGERRPTRQTKPYLPT